jgi:hypothetical protein
LTSIKREADGYAAVGISEGPGLGVEVDRDAITRFTVAA